MVEDKDVILAIVPGGLGLSALLLVFTGFAIRELDDLLDTARHQEFRARILVLRGLILGASLAIVLGAAVSGLGVAWLLTEGDAPVFNWVVGVFYAALGVTAALAVTTGVKGILS